MKKALRRVAALLCALLMIAELQYVQAAETVIFTAVNETVLELSDANMPFWANGHLYVSYNMFSGKELGISYSNNTVTRIVTLYNDRGALQFHLDKNTVTNGQGSAMSPAAVVRGGRVFLPIQMVADFFGLAYTSNPVALGYVIRLRSEDSVLNDRLFLDAATSLLEYRYEQYQQAKAAAENPQVVTPDPPVVTPDPPNPPDPPKPPDPPDPPDPSLEKRTVYLSFRVTEETPALLDVLDDAGAYGTFFFTREQIASNAALARRLLVTGHAIGLIADGANAETAVTEQLQSANRELWRLTGWKTRLCLLENGTADQRETAREAGYCCLQADLDRSSASLRENNAGALYRTIHNNSEDAVTVLLSSDVQVNGLQALLKEAAVSEDQLPALTEIVAGG